MLRHSVLSISMLSVLTGCTAEFTSELSHSSEESSEIAIETNPSESGSDPADAIFNPNKTNYFFVTDDAFVSQTSAGTNYGASPELLSMSATEIENSSEFALLKFKLPEIPTTDLTAELTYFHTISAQKDTLAQVTVALVENEWSEDFVTWQNAPAERFSVSVDHIASLGGESPSWESVDVTLAVQTMIEEGEREISLSLKNHSGYLQTIYSREQHDALMGAVLTLTPSNLSADNDSSNNDSEGSDSGSSDSDNLISLENGQTLYTAQCAGCHGTIGDGKPQGSSIVSTLYGAGFATIIETTMPFGSAGSCDKTCSDDITAWLKTLHENPAGSSGNDSGNDSDDDSSNSGNTGGSNENTGDLDTSETITATQSILLNRLYKASMNLNSIVPKISWVNLVMINGEAGLHSALDQMLEEESFYHRVKEIYAPTLQYTNTPSGAYIRTFDGDEEWHEGFSDDKSKFARNASRDSLKNSAIELVRYVVKNNKPFTEILTADYQVLNYFGARMLNLHDQGNFTEIDDAEYSGLPYSTDEFVKVKSPTVPMAGVLTTSAFIQKYPTTATNVNRHRSYHVYKMFLDTNILEISGSRVEADDINVEHPTLTSPACTGCHVVMDPVSSTFRHWQRGNERRDDYNNAKWDQSTILEPGFNGVLMPAAELAPLQWLAPRVANDARFGRATVKTLFEEITGHKVLIQPTEMASQLEHQRYEYQKTVISELADNFIASNHNFKTLVKDLLMSDYFNGEIYVGGTARLIPAERFVRKLLATTNDNSFTRSSTLLSSSNYQGDMPTGTMALIHQYTASYISCEALSTDLNKPYDDRLLLPNFLSDVELFDSSGGEISSTHNDVKSDIQNLMWVMWGQSVSVNDEVVTDLYNTYLNFVNSGTNDYSDRKADSRCRFNDPVSGDNYSVDENFRLRAWVALMNLMIDDYRYLYE